MRFLTWGTCFILYILFENHLNVWLSVSMDWFARFSLYIYCPCIHIMQNFWTLWSLSTSQRRVSFSINGQTNKKKQFAGIHTRNTNGLIQSVGLLHGWTSNILAWIWEDPQEHKTIILHLYFALASSLVPLAHIWHRPDKPTCRELSKYLIACIRVNYSLSQHRTQRLKKHRQYPNRMPWISYVAALITIIKCCDTLHNEVRLD